MTGQTKGPAAKIHGWSGEVKGGRGEVSNGVFMDFPYSLYNGEPRSYSEFRNRITGVLNVF